MMTLAARADKSPGCLIDPSREVSVARAQSAAKPSSVTPKSSIACSTDRSIKLAASAISSASATRRRKDASSSFNSIANLHAARLKNASIEGAGRGVTTSVRAAYPLSNFSNPTSASRASICRLVLSPAFVQSRETTHLAVSSVISLRASWESKSSRPARPSINASAPRRRSRDDLLPPAPGRHGALSDIRVSGSHLCSVGRSRQVIRQAGASGSRQIFMDRHDPRNTLSDSLSAPISSGSPACDCGLVGGVGDGFHFSLFSKRSFPRIRANGPRNLLSNGFPSGANRFGTNAIGLFCQSLINTTAPVHAHNMNEDPCTCLHLVGKTFQ